MRLLVATCTFTSPYIVEENGKRADTEVVHKLQLINNVHAIGLVPLDIFSRMDSPHEIDLVSLGCINIRAYLFGLVGGIVLTPAGTVINIVFGTIDVDIHLLATKHFEKAHTVGLAVRVAIVTLDKTAMRHTWIVGHGCCHNLRLCG